MFRKLQFVFVVAFSMLTFIGFAKAQAPIAPIHQIKLPIPESHGRFESGWPALGEPNSYWSTMKLLPDQRLLVMNPNASGEWSLTRVGNWWTDSPTIDSLIVRGWTAANTRRGAITCGLLITDDGSYAVLLGSVDKVKDADHMPFQPQVKVDGWADTLIVLIDLRHWQVARTFHTATLGNFRFHRAQIVGGHWIALNGNDHTAYPDKYAHVFGEVNQLISIPDLAVGPFCVSTGSEILTTSLGQRTREEMQLAFLNRQKCAALLQAANLGSINRLESLLHLGESPVPEAFDLPERYIRYSTGGGPTDQRNFNHRAVLGREILMTPEADNFYSDSDNAPRESELGYWYQTRHAARSRTKTIVRYDADGKLLAERETSITSLAGCDRYGCSCRVEAAREDAGTVMVFCHAYTVGLFDEWHEKKFWVAVFHTSDLSEAARIPLPNVRKSMQTLATANGQSYVLALEEGRILRVYPITNTQTGR